ncbi:transmembrane and coiled-coil domain-containing protein STS1-like [Apium graveolens]|uniref:transmembrane and coiled-coil domain-containing protein STS1-like n=1 Tax=Apium graveolens TaxID=4045 RepID=UPI003D790DF8
MMRDRAAFEQKVKEYCKKYAKAEDIQDIPEEILSDEQLSEAESNSSDELHSLVSALACPIALLNVLDRIDSKWAIAVDRADQVGLLLTEEVLLKGLHGKRPVPLVGFSLGA